MDCLFRYLYLTRSYATHLALNDRVQYENTVDAENLRVRNAPAGSTVINSVSHGSKGTIKGGPTGASLNGIFYQWYDILWDNGIRGWSAEGDGTWTWLVKLTTAFPGSFTLTATGLCNGDAEALDAAFPSNSTRIHLHWTPSSNATSYDVYRNGSLYFPDVIGTHFTNTNKVGSSVLNVTAGTTYEYFVRANNTSGFTCAASGWLHKGKYCSTGSGQRRSSMEINH